MNRISFFLFFLFASAISAFSQQNETLITIGDAKISKGEFERIYQKNNSNLYNKDDKKSPEAYVDMFIDFKLKVLEAMRLKMDTSTSFTTELAGYRSELAAPYLTDVSYSHQMVVELYDRTTKEVNASHLLLTVKEDAPAKEVNDVFQKIQNIRNEILAGKNFGEAAAEYSEDPSAKTNLGNLGYFTAFQMVVPFENAAFSTPVGQISEPVRSAFGWHILKVHDIRPNPGELEVAHIMKIFPQDMSPETKKALKTEIDSLYSQLLKGADFTELAKTKSDDKRSAPEGGVMPWFSAGRMITEFATPAFALKNIGDITEPIETPFGYHIIKKLDAHPVATFEESKAMLESRIKQDPQRSETSKTIFIEKLKKEYNYKVNNDVVESISEKNIEDSVQIANQQLFVLNGKSYATVDYQNWLENENIENGFYGTFFQKWVDAEITAYEDSRLEDKYPDFRYLIQEYHDGILLFNISEEKIWNFAATDSTGLEDFYNKNSNKYMWEERFKGMIIRCINDSVREEAEKFFAAEMTSQEITDLLNETSNSISIQEGAWEKGSNPIVDYYVWNGPEISEFKSELTFIRGDKIKPEPKTLDEARGLYISDYQNFVEQNWLKELKKSFKITINKKLLKTIEGV